jgi:hypothetical protein
MHPASGRNRPSRAAPGRRSNSIVAPLPAPEAATAEMPSLRRWPQDQFAALQSAREHLQQPCIVYGFEQARIDPMNNIIYLVGLVVVVLAVLAFFGLR